MFRGTWQKKLIFSHKFAEQGTQGFYLEIMSVIRSVAAVAGRGSSDRA